MITKADGFVTYEKFGAKLRHMLALGYDITVILTDEFWNGYMEFIREGSTTIIVPFEKFNTFDEVEVSYNELAEIKKDY